MGDAMEAVFAVIFGFSFWGALYGAVPTGVLMIVNGTILDGDWLAWWTFLPLFVFCALGGVAGFRLWLNGDFG